MNILIVAPSWVGDLILAHSLIRDLHKTHPSAKIDVLALEWCQACLERMPHVNKILTMPIGHGHVQLFKRYKLGKSLENHYDKAYILPNSWKSALIPFFARIPIRIGWRGELRFGLLTECKPLNKTRFPLMVQRYVALNHGADFTGKTIPLPKLTVTAAQKQNVLEKFNLTCSPPVIVFAPGAAFGGAKQYPTEHFATLASTFQQQGFQVWQMGSVQDEPIMAEIDQKSGRKTIILGEKATLADKIDLISQAALLISNDSGLMHVGSALDIPVIALYGSTSPKFTPPLGKRSKALFRNDLSCRPCFKRQCPLKGTEKLACLTGISPKLVLETAQHLLNA